EQQAVDEGSEDFDAMVPERLARRRRELRQPHGEQADTKSADIGKHVSGVGEQRQAIGGQATQELDDAIGRSDEKRDKQVAAVASDVAQAIPDLNPQCLDPRTVTARARMSRSLGIFLLQLPLPIEDTCLGSPGLGLGDISGALIYAR